MSVPFFPSVLSTFLYICLSLPVDVCALDVGKKNVCAQVHVEARGLGQVSLLLLSILLNPELTELASLVG